LAELLKERFNPRWACASGSAGFDTSQPYAFAALHRPTMNRCDMDFAPTPPPWQHRGQVGEGDQRIIFAVVIVHARSMTHDRGDSAPVHRFAERWQKRPPVC